MATQISSCTPNNLAPIWANFGPNTLANARAASRLEVDTLVDGTSGASATRETISTRLASSIAVLR